MQISLRLPTHLDLYTAGARDFVLELDDDATLAAALAALDERHPGLRFRIVDEQDRIRRHIKIFVGADLAKDLGRRLREGEAVMVVAALSGG